MQQRTARRGKQAGSRFWGCTDYPACKGTRPLEVGKKPTDPSDRTDRPDKKRPTP
ncbi:MAG: hypothetical protein JEZ11_14110 [Desulfobacterales bacterium]|nr:hypothetical protein [Desulfobacterales bacterium]